MRCDRCGSAMIQEKFYGPQEHFHGWRCIFCGEIIDPVILQNRRGSRPLWPITPDTEDKVQWQR
ncbi:MAG: hypothetical protein HXY46_14340 [Syntrophaceae bacterium]|nr:hypothetical protein [Syntrophaceae bacterium]